MDTAHPPRRVRRRLVGAIGRAAGTAVAVAFAFFSLTVSVAVPSQATPGTTDTGLLLAWLVGLVPVVGLVWRRRLPVTICLVAAALELALPLDAFTSLLALTWVVARRPPRLAWLCAAATTAATAASLWRDAARPASAAVFALTDHVTGERLMLAPFGYVVLGAVCVLTAIGVGLLRRLREVASRAEVHAQAEAATADALRVAMTRQEERELIAREVHDTVAHHLSLISLHASALEVSRGEDPAVLEAAASVRSAAHGALEELRDLIAVLRDPPPEGIGGRPGSGQLSLADLPELVASAREAGADISATVFVADVGAAPPALTRAAYRIVQEALTNVLRHAPGAPVQIDLRAAPASGVSVVVRNPLRPGAEPRPGGRAGLVGMRERTALLGGRFWAGEAGGWFEVRAELPWSAPPVG